MNKMEFINKLSNTLGYSEDKCIIINDILESNFFISKKNKDIILNSLKLKLSIDYDEAKRIYEVARTIISDEVKNQLRHPFRG